MVESLLISLPNKVKKSSTSSLLPAVRCRLRLLFLLSSFPRYSHNDDKENHHGPRYGGGGVYAIDVPESEFVTSSTVFGTGDHHDHSLIDDYDHEIWNNNVVSKNNYRILIVTVPIAAF